MCNGLQPTGGILGIVEDQPFRVENVNMGHGDILLLFTDGISEAQDAHGALYGEDRLRAFLANHHDADAKHLALALMDEVTQYVVCHPTRTELPVDSAAQSPEGIGTQLVDHRCKTVVATIAPLRTQVNPAHGEVVLVHYCYALLRRGLELAKESLGCLTRGIHVCKRLYQVYVSPGKSACGLHEESAWRRPCSLMFGCEGINNHPTDVMTCAGVLRARIA